MKLRIKRLAKTLAEMGEGEFTTLQIMREYNSRVSGYHSITTNQIGNYLGKNPCFEKSGYCEIRKLHLWKLNPDRL